MIARVPPPTTVADLERFSDANPGWFVERESDGTIVMRPSDVDTGRRRVELGMIVANWSESTSRGRIFAASTGFTMPDGAVLSPNCSWIAPDRWAAVTREQRMRYAPIVPDVCIEVASPWRSFGEAVAKARRFRAYGATFVLALDPRHGEVWRDGRAPHGFPTDFSSVIGHDADGD